MLVNPKYQGAGVGTELIEQLKKKYDGYLYLILTSENRDILGFYENRGFQVVEGAIPMVLRANDKL